MNPTWMSFLTVGLGGASGAIARYAVTMMLQRGTGSIPLGTLASNLLGCFVMGILAQLAVSTSWFNSEGLFPGHYWLLFAVGFCGSFTTLSALIFELHDMLQGGQMLTMAAYLSVSVFGGFASLYLGMLLVRA